MSKKNIILTLIVIALVICVAIFREYILGICFFLIWFVGTMIYEFSKPISMLILPNPPVPEIEYGSFPYEIVYSVDGEEFKKVDTLEFKYATESDYDRVEKIAFWGSSEYFVLLCEIQGEKIYIDGGSGKYYMMNEKPYEDYVPGQYIYYYDSGKVKLSVEEAKEQLGIEIISTKFSEPIENNKYKFTTGYLYYKLYTFLNPDYEGWV